MNEPIKRPPDVLTADGRLAVLLLRANGLSRFAEFEEAVNEVAHEIHAARDKCPQSCGKTWTAAS